MPTQWNDWVHAMWSARGQRLPGDARGFRDHDHRIHSSGDYRSPPPESEHEGLRRHARAITKRVVFFPMEVRPRLAQLVAEKLDTLNIATRIVAIDATHAHALIHVGDRDAKPLIARAKQHASVHVRERLPGSIWGDGCHVVRVEDEGHWRATVDYIADHANRGASIWEPEKFAQRRANQSGRRD